MTRVTETNRDETAIWNNSWRHRLFGIRNKIVIPYLTITLLVAAVGTFVVTRLVAGSLQERLSNQLVESSRVAQESIVRREVELLDTLRLIVHARDADLDVGGDMGTRIREKDTDFIALVTNSIAGSQGIPDVTVLDAEGNPLCEYGDFVAETGFLYKEEPAIKSVLNGTRENLDDKFGALAYARDSAFFYVVAPVPDAENPNQVSGAIVAGMPLRTILLRIKADSLADTIAYNLDGQFIDSTFFLSDAEKIDLTITSEIVGRELSLLGREDPKSSYIEAKIGDRDYQGVYIPL